MMGFVALGSGKQELINAPAVAVDMGALETRGREEAGDLPGIIQLLDSINAQIGNCLRLRVIRKVLEDGGPHGAKGDIVDMTEYDRQFVMFRSFMDPDERPDLSQNHWYLEEQVSPAILVLETAYGDVEGGGVVLPKDEELVPVLKKIKRAMEASGEGMAYELLWHGILQMNPSVGLPKVGMEPRSIVEFMQSKGAVSSEGRMTFSRDDMGWGD